MLFVDPLSKYKEELSQEGLFFELRSVERFMTGLFVSYIIKDSFGQERYWFGFSADLPNREIDKIVQEAVDHARTTVVVEQKPSIILDILPKRHIRT